MLYVQTGGKHFNLTSSSNQPWIKVVNFLNTFFMKSVLAISIGILTLSVMSFRSFQHDKISLLKDGNYSVPAGIITGNDARMLGELTRKSAGETVVVQKTISKSFNETQAVHETVWSHKSEIKSAKSMQTYSRVKGVMDKYLN